MNVWQFSFTQSWWSQERWPLRRPFMTQWSHCSAKSQNKTKQKERQEPLAWKSYNTMRNWLHQDMSIPAERKWLTQFFIKKYLHTGIIVLIFFFFLDKSSTSQTFAVYITNFKEINGDPNYEKLMAARIFWKFYACYASIIFEKNIYEIKLLF